VATKPLVVEVGSPSRPAVIATAAALALAAAQRMPGNLSHVGHDPAVELPTTSSTAASLSPGTGPVQSCFARRAPDRLF